MEQQHHDAIKKIVQFTKQDSEFDIELRKALDIPSAKSAYSNETSSNDVRLIREILEIRANCSINYNFVKNERTRDQLIIDNLRMENAILKSNTKEENRYYHFCVNAFYQIENIINYYLFTKYPIFEDLLIFIKDNSREERFQYKRKEEDNNVSHIPIAYKLNAVCNFLFPKDKFKLTLGNLRKVRNEGEHRCTIIFSEKNEKETLYNLYKYNTTNDIRSHLNKLITSIKHDLENNK